MNAYLGVDIGSISTKGVIIDDNNNILASNYIWTQGNPIEAVKKLYPEKKGNVLDTKFVKDWFNSCDEAERQKIGEASYFAYRMMSMTALGLLIISILISSTLQLGPFPTLAIGVMMFVGTFSYLYKCRTLEKGKRI